jgi:glycosyltransferase involved in cell wall biosynthesis
LKIAITADPEIPVPPELYGGIERIIYMLVTGLAEKGHDVTLFAHPDSKVPCRLVKWNARSSNGIGNIIANAATLLKHTSSGKFDVLHSFSRLAYLLPLLPARLPKIMSYQREPSLGQIKKAAGFARKNSLMFTGCSDYITEKIQRVSKAITIYNGIPAGAYDAKDRVAPDAPLMFLGRIEEIKGPHIAIDVAKKSGRNLVLAGNIPSEGESYFEKMIRPQLNGQIRYVGPVNDQQKNDLLGTSCALLMPIQWNEPFGIVMAEAMACGTPVLGFPFGSVPEVVDDGVTGFICTDTEDMVRRVHDIPSLNRKKVRLIADQRFSDEVIIHQYIALYESMMEEAAG